ncbi:MAG: tRNA pseudouridine(55) synthase TruB [Myxococcaceae bacterium]
MSPAVRPGLYLAHKPVGPTSFTLVRALQDELGSARKLPVSHGGTLDPFAEGLLLLLVGPATRLMDLLHPAPKTYVAELAWGAETDNGDLLGKVVAEGDPTGLTPRALDEALGGFLGWREQVPPTTSAKKVGGEPAYRKVHRGEAVVLPPSRVFLHSARWLSHELPGRSRLELVCRGGYYVRALARDLGQKLGARAHLTRLARTRIGPWEDPGPERRVGVFGEDLLPWFGSRELTDDEARALRRGQAIPRGRLRRAPFRFPEGFPEPEPLVRGLRGGALWALLESRDGQLWPRVDLRPGV